MPNYPSNYNNSSLGVESSLTQNNPARRRELRDLVDSNGMTTLTDSTRTWADLLLAIDNLEEEIAVKDAWAAPVAGVVLSSSGATNIVSDTVALLDTDDAYNGYLLVVTSGTRKDQVAKVTDYVGSSNTFVLGAGLAGAAADNDTFVLVAPQSASAGFDFDITSLSTSEKAYISNLFSLQIHHVQEQLEQLARSINRLRVDVAKVNTDGVPAAGRYPSGYDRGW